MPGLSQYVIRLHFLILLSCFTGFFNAVDAGPINALKSVKTSVIRANKRRPLAMPTDVAVGNNGSIYVVDGVNHRIVVFNSFGKQVFTFGKIGRGPGRFSRPLGIDVGANGTVYVADTGNRRVQAFSAKGKFLYAILCSQKKNSKKPDISDVVVHPDQTRLYLVDNENHRILIYDLLKKQFIKVWGGPGTAKFKFQYPFLATMTPKGNLLVTETINARVQVINKEGLFISFLGTWGVKPGQLFRPKGVAVKGPYIFVTESYLGSVQVFDILGKYLGQLCNAVGKPLSFKTPTGIAVDSERKRLYVVECLSNQVRCIYLK